ncbi:MAG TPA: glycosyltransferase family 39 protein [Gemmatimonadales bacterium]
MRLPRIPDRHRTLVLLLLLALALRVAWWTFYVDIIENEGVEYARLAWNLFHGRGYVGIFGGTHTHFPPFYPLLIGLVAPVAGSEEAAARLISLLAGVATVGAIYHLARRIFDDRVAWLAGALVACHPLLVALSVTTYTEGLFLALSSGCALATVSWIATPSPWRAIAVGALAGFSYLTRPEGIALAAAFGGLLVLAGGLRHHAWRTGLAHASLIALVAALIASPYVAYLSRLAGGFRWEGKSAHNAIQAGRMAEGMTLNEASRGLTPEGTAAGPSLIASQDSVLSIPASRHGGLRFLMRDPVERFEEIGLGIVRAGFLGAPMLLLLGLSGILLTQWWRNRLLEALALLALPVLGFLVLLAVRWTWPRYFFPLLPGSLVWAAAGADRIAQLVVSGSARIGLPARLHPAARASMAVVLALSVLVLAARDTTSVADLSQTRNGDLRAAGQWIRGDYLAAGEGDSPPLIASLGVALAYYAGGEVVYLPFADEPRALRFLHAAAPDYLAIRDSELARIPFAQDWFDGRVGDACIHPVTTLPPAAASHVRIWRWTC